MRRKQRSVVHLVLFLIVLLAIIFLGRSPSPKQGFAWTRIRYESSATSGPLSHGICPGLAPEKPALVVARVQADGSPVWLDALSDKYHVCIYTADAPVDPAATNLQVPANRGHEAMAYLTFIIDNYDSIPDAGAVFVHGSRYSWHNDDPHYDNVALLASLDVSAALEFAGYHNLRCDWSASTCDESAAPPQGSFENSVRAVLQPNDPRVVSDSALPRSLAILFGDAGRNSAHSQDEVLLGRGDAVRSQCCAQFTVSRQSIWQHSQAEYAALRQWLLDGSTPLDGIQRSHSRLAAPSDDRIAGRILSYVWHILFIKQTGDTLIDLHALNQLACPRADECYCRLYGRCDLRGCTSPGHCLGQYQIPPGFRLPDIWAMSHSKVE